MHHIQNTFLIPHNKRYIYQIFFFLLEYHFLLLLCLPLKTLLVSFLLHFKLNANWRDFAAIMLYRKITMNFMKSYATSKQIWKGDLILNWWSMKMDSDAFDCRWSKMVVMSIKKLTLKWLSNIQENYILNFFWHYKTI